MADSIAVVIPVLDRTTLIGDALDSVFAQTRRPEQIIVVDDGSTDGTLELLRGYGDRITILTSDRAGPAGARNRGLAEVRCGQVAFLDSDDLWRPAALATLSDAMTAERADAAWGLAETEVMAGGALPNPLWPIAATRLVLIPSMLFRTASLRDLGGFDADLRFGEDGDLVMRMRREAWAVVELDEAVLLHRRHPDNMTLDRQGAAGAWFDLARKAMHLRRSQGR